MYSGLDNNNNKSDDNLKDEKNNLEEEVKAEPVLKPIVNDLNTDIKKDFNLKKKDYKVSHDIFKIFGLILSGLLLVISVITIKESFVPEIKTEDNILSYNVTNGVDYKIHLIANDFYEASTIGMEELVPVTFIDKIEINFSNYFSATKELNLNYSYRITGELVAVASDNGNEKTGGKIWSKNYNFVNSDMITEENKTNFNINENIVIDYAQYNNLVNQYKLKAAVPMDAYLNVKLTVIASSSIDNNNLNETNTIDVKIPMSVATVMVKTENIGSTPKNLIKTDVIPANNNYTLLGISVVIFIGSLVATILLLRGLRKMTEDHSLIIKFNKIMKDYDQIVVEIESLPFVKNASIIEVRNFRDMVDIQKELHLPILCCRSDILTENIFYIINQNQIFKYKMNAELEKL